MAERHDLIWLETGTEALAQPGTCVAVADADAHLADWIAADRPLVVTRQPQKLPPGRILLGLPLPPSAGKHRITFDAPASAIARCEPPPPLDRIADRLPKAWWPAIHALLASPAIRAAEPRVFGSAAMQAMTGIACMSKISDLDLLLRPPNRAAAQAALDALTHIDTTHHPLHLDGEIVDPAGRATSWRELASESRDVLFKHIERIGLIPREDFLAGFGEATA